MWACVEWTLYVGLPVAQRDPGWWLVLPCVWWWCSGCSGTPSPAPVSGGPCRRRGICLSSASCLQHQHSTTLIPAVPTRQMFKIFTLVYQSMLFFFSCPPHPTPLNSPITTSLPLFPNLSYLILLKNTVLLNVTLSKVVKTIYKLEKFKTLVYILFSCTHNWVNPS